MSEQRNHLTLSHLRARSNRFLFFATLFLTTSISSASVTPKIQFEFLMIPDDVKVEAQRDLTLCLVNVGEENRLLNSDNLTLSILLGTGQEDLAEAAGAVNLSCASPAGWACSVDTSDPTVAQVNLAPVFQIFVESLETICFDLTGLVVNSVEGVAFLDVDQKISPSRARKPSDPILKVFKSIGGTILHDDLGNVLPDQHHPQTWEVIGDDIRALNEGHVLIGPAGGAQAKLTVTGAGIEDSLRVQTAGDTALMVSGDGLVGVGTDVPSARLDVRAQAGENPLQVTLAGGGAPDVAVRSDGKVVVGQTGGALARLTVDSDKGEEALRVRNDGITSFAVASDGQVGVGTSSPGARLDVRSRLAEDPFQVRLHGVAEPDVAILSNGKMIVGQTGGTLARLTVDSRPGEEALRVRVDNATKLFVGANGNVGVGTASPGSSLEVNGDVTADNLLLTERIGIGTTSPERSLHIVNSDVAQLRTQATSTEEDVVLITSARSTNDGIERAEIGTLSEHDVVLFANGLFAIIIRADGEVCLGTSC